MILDQIADKMEHDSENWKKVAEYIRGINQIEEKSLAFGVYTAWQKYINAVPLRPMNIPQ